MAAIHVARKRRAQSEPLISTCLSQKRSSTSHTVQDESNYDDEDEAANEQVDHDAAPVMEKRKQQQNTKGDVQVGENKTQSVDSAARAAAAAAGYSPICAPGTDETNARRGMAELQTEMTERGSDWASAQLSFE